MSFRFPPEREAERSEAAEGNANGYSTAAGRASSPLAVADWKGFKTSTLFKDSAAKATTNVWKVMAGKW